MTVEASLDLVCNLYIFKYLKHCVNVKSVCLWCVCTCARWHFVSCSYLIQSFESVEMLTKTQHKNRCITVAGCNFQLIGAQWCLFLGEQQSETFRCYSASSSLCLPGCFLNTFQQWCPTSRLVFLAASPSGFPLSENIFNSWKQRIRIQSQQLLNDAASLWATSQPEIERMLMC